jgi:hypothetical protein
MYVTGYIRTDYLLRFKSFSGIFKEGLGDEEWNNGIIE